jgi:hypothetical protein
MALHGVRGLAVGDVDLLMSRRDAADLLRSKGIEPAPGEAGGRFHSDVFGRWRAGGYIVETMGGFHVDRRELVSELVAMCELFGRSKDEDRARRLRAI